MYNQHLEARANVTAPVFVTANVSVSASACVIVNVNDFVTARDHANVICSHVNKQSLTPLVVVDGTHRG
jgi:hypothetical protein